MGLTSAGLQDVQGRGGSRAELSRSKGLGGSGQDEDGGGELHGGSLCGTMILMA